MPRQTKLVIVNEEGRDKGKAFVLTEMPASQAEKWAARAALAISRSEIGPGDVPEGSGMAGLAILGLKVLSKMSFADAEPLMDEMFGCVRIVPDIAANPDYARALVEEDIEEVATRLRLRADVMELHTGFSLAGALSRLTSISMPA